MTATVPRWVVRNIATRPACPHTPTCPKADAVDHDAARVIADHHDQGWVLMCNGIIAFDDTGELVPDPDEPCGCHIEQPHRGPAPHNNRKEQ